MVTYDIRKLIAVSTEKDRNAALQQDVRAVIRLLLWARDEFATNVPDPYCAARIEDCILHLLRTHAITSSTLFPPNV